MFQQRHFEAIAQMMQRLKPLDDEQLSNLQWDQTVLAMADLFQRENGRFMRERFIGACERGANVRARSHPPRKAA